ncbi:expressed unknown protein [Seminavis robusta]|uniref:Uncharacterized protein n=1 Tax=Seminavis robusta TaxID=568900 RepID=A0A9N8EYL4_9STRA|nr:expressed unknown protein [Seminavis robusta]|eukprot:Sro2113_g315090.1 n/a (352) ;mRNA; r:16961-18016
MRTSQSSLWMKAIGVLLENVDHFHIDRPEMTNDEITRLLTMLCRSTNSTDRVSFGPKFLQKIANTGSLEEIVAPANQELEDAGRKSPIEEVYLEYNSTPDFGIHALLLQMKSLTRLDIKVSQPFKATKEMCESLCVLLMQGSVVELNLQAATEEEGLFLPLLDAANQSDHLCDLRLQDLGNQAEVEIYQDEILRILENNTDLDLALVCQDIRTMVDETNYLADETNYLAMKAHVNKECFLDRTESDNKQRLIDYKTLLNLCGRRETMEETIQLEDFVGCLCGEAIGDWIVHFLEDVTGESKEELITILQYGLLRQQPATWLPQDTKGSRKRKATGPPEDLAVHKTKLLSSK